MAQKKAKAQSKPKVKKERVSPEKTEVAVKQMSPIIQFGIVFLMVAAIALLAYAFKNY